MSEGGNDGAKPDRWPAGEERQAFLLKLSDALRPLGDPMEIQAVALRVLGEHLEADRVFYAEIDEERDEYVINRNYANGVPPLLGRFRLSEIAQTAELAGSGQMVIVEDANVDPRLSEAERASYAKLNMAAAVGVPLIKDGRWVAGLGIQQSTPRNWTPEEISLVRETAERIWPAVERASAEEASRESEEKYRTLVENISDHAIFMLDAEGFVTSWTKSAERVKGYATEEVIGRHVSMFYAPEAVEAGDPDRELAEAAREGRAEREQWRVRKDGQRIWVNEIVTAVRDGNGNLIGFTKISRDLTERHRAEDALRQSEERLGLAVEAADLGRWELVPETGEFHTSATCNRHIGLPYDARPTHEGHFENIHPDDHEMIYEGLRRATDEVGEFVAEYRVLHPEGEVRRIFSRARLLRNRGRSPDRLVGVTLDVTEARELESERERSRAHELAARAEASERERISRELHDRVAHHMGVAHQSLELYAALREAAPGRAQERLDLARGNTRLALDQTRALSAELKRLQEEELGEGIKAAFRTLAESYVPDAIEVDLSFSGEESAIPNPIGLQVYLAMREALRNAVKHSGCSRIGITLEVADGELRRVVDDDGEGFDPEEVDKATPSWGVGLRSMRERAVMLGGELRVDSWPGDGTRVGLKVPLDGRRP